MLCGRKLPSQVPQSFLLSERNERTERRRSGVSEWSELSPATTQFDSVPSTVHQTCLNHQRLNFCSRHNVWTAWPIDLNFCTQLHGHCLLCMNNFGFNQKSFDKMAPVPGTAAIAHSKLRKSFATLVSIEQGCLKSGPRYTGGPLKNSKWTFKHLNNLIVI